MNRREISRFSQVYNISSFFLTIKVGELFSYNEKLVAHEEVSLDTIWTLISL